MADMQIPFLLDKDGQSVDGNVELALCLADIKAEAAKGLTFLKSSEERVELAAKIGWPLMLKRTSSGYLVLDTAGILGEGVLLQSDPQRREMRLDLPGQGDFTQGVIALAKEHANPKSYQHNFSCIVDIKEAIHALTEGVPSSGAETHMVQIAPNQLTKAEEEVRLFLTWIASLRDSADELDGMLPDLSEAMEKRLLVLEDEQHQAMKPLGEQLSQLRPRVEADIRALEEEHRRELELFDAQLARDTDSWQVYLKGAQAAEREYQNTIGELADYYHEQVKLAQEEIKALVNEHTRQAKELGQQLSGQIGVARRPLATLEHRVAMTNRYWELAASREKSLVAAAMQILQQAAETKRGAARELEQMALNPEMELGDQQMLTVPFYLARYPGRTPRYRVLPPSRLQAKGQLASLFSGVVGGVALPMEPRSGAWEIMAQRIQDLLQSGDIPAPVWDALNRGNLLANAEVTAQALDGLEQMVKSGVLKPKQAEQLKTRIE